jgi:hypothetical protein
MGNPLGGSTLQTKISSKDHGRLPTSANRSLAALVVPPSDPPFGRLWPYACSSRHVIGSPQTPEDFHRRRLRLSSPGSKIPLNWRGLSSGTDCTVVHHHIASCSFRQLIAQIPAPNGLVLAALATRASPTGSRSQSDAHGLPTRPGARVTGSARIDSKSPRNRRNGGQPARKLWENLQHQQP